MTGTIKGAPMQGDALADSTLLQNRLISKLNGGLKLTLGSRRWTEREDELPRELVDAGAPVKSICETLNRSEAELRRRGYYIGLPRKWLKRTAAV